MEDWTDPKHIIHWNQASTDWHSPRAANDLREKGKFSYRMEAKDGIHGFDFEGVYDQVRPHERISYTMSDGRKVWVEFHEVNGTTEIKEKFEAESSHPVDMQRDGWQAILDRFKAYVEQN